MYSFAVLSLTSPHYWLIKFYNYAVLPFSSVALIRIHRVEKRRPFGIARIRLYGYWIKRDFHEMIGKNKYSTVHYYFLILISIFEGLFWVHLLWENNDTNCHRLNVCVPLRVMCWNLILRVLALEGGTFRRWLEHEGGVLMNGIYALTKETPQSSLASSHHLRTPWKDGRLWTRKWVHPQ